jgi:hypothetical protein
MVLRLSGSGDGITDFYADRHYAILSGNDERKGAIDYTIVPGRDDGLIGWLVSGTHHRLRVCPAESTGIIVRSCSFGLSVLVALPETIPMATVVFRHRTFVQRHTLTQDRSVLIDDYSEESSI